MPNLLAFIVLVPALAAFVFYTGLSIGRGREARDSRPVEAPPQLSDQDMLRAAFDRIPSSIYIYSGSAFGGDCIRASYRPAHSEARPICILFEFDRTGRLRNVEPYAP